MECKEYTSESDESIAIVHVSRLITEEDLTDSLFYTCDVDLNGKIPVSRLIEYLKFTAGQSIEDDDLEKLCEFLDPTNMDFCINLAAYRSGIADWIQYVRQKQEKREEEVAAAAGDVQNEHESSFEGERIDPFSYLYSPNLCTSTPKKTSSPGNALQPVVFPHVPHGKALALASSGGGEDGPVARSPVVAVPDSGRDAPSLLNKPQMGDIDMTELLNKLGELQFSSRKLQEENGQLRHQLIVAEDTATQNASQSTHMHQAEKNYHKTSARLQELRRENEELRGSVVTNEDRRRQVDSQLHDQQKANHQLQNTVSALQSQLSDSREDYELAMLENSKLQHVLIEKKQLKTEAEDLSEVKTTQLSQKTGIIEEMQEALTEFNKVNENLRLEKTELELQLSQTEQELASARITVDSLGGNYSDNCGDEASVPLKHTRNQDQEEDEEEPMPAPLKLFTEAASASSTPCKKDSICSELKSGIHDAPDMPSPLCDKEMESVLQELEDSNLYSDPEHEIMASSKVARVALEFKQKKEVVLQHISELTKAFPATSRSSSCTLPTTTAASVKHVETAKVKLQREINMFVKKIASLAASNQNYQTRISRLTEALRNIKDEKLEMEEQHLDSLSAMESRTQHVSAALQERFDAISEELKKETELRHELEQQRSEIECKLEVIAAGRDEAEGRAHDLEQLNRDMCHEIEQVRKSHVVLDDRYKKAEAHMSDLKEEVDEKTSTCSREKHRNQKLEESLSLQRMNQQVDMRDLWRLVQKDVEMEANHDSDTQDDVGASASTDCLREQVAKEIVCLRSQLARSQRALETLTRTTLPLSSTTADGDYAAHNPRRHNDNSPLVDALTLDLLQGAPAPNNHSAATKGGSGSADNIVDSDSAYFDANYNLQGSDSTSCPHLLDDRVTSHSTQTDYSSTRSSSGHHHSTSSKRRPPAIGASRYMPVNTSTGSSTSGVEVSSVSTSRSGDIHRKSVLIVETACTPELSSPEDPDNPLCRYRTSSFKRAIERGQSNDSSNQSFDTYDPISTSPDLTPDRPELPPAYTSDHHFSSSLLPPAPAHHQEVTVNFALTPEQYSVHAADSDYSISDYTLKALSGSPYSKQALSGPSSTAPASVHKQPESILKEPGGEGKNRKSKKVDVEELGGGGLWDLERQDSGDNMDQVFLDSADSSAAAASGNLLTVTDLDGRLSPGQSRRLSTLPEEGSDAEADESLTSSSHMPIAPPRCKKSPPRSPNAAVGVVPGRSTTSPSRHSLEPSHPQATDPFRASSRSPDPAASMGRASSRSPDPRQRSPDPPRGYSPEPAAAGGRGRVASRSPDTASERSRTPPYKAPPPYMVSSSDSSPRRLPESELATIPPVTSHPSGRPLPPPPYRKPEHPPPYHQTRRHFSPPPAAPSSAKPEPPADNPAEYSGRARSNSNRSSATGEEESPRPLSAMGRERRKSLEESRNKPLTSIGLHGEVVDLVNGELDEIELSDADRLMNAQLIQEAQKASQESKHRDRRASRRSKKGSPDLSRSVSIDEGDDVFPSTPEADVTLTAEPTSPESKLQIRVDPPTNSLPLKPAAAQYKGCVDNTPDGGGIRQDKEDRQAQEPVKEKKEDPASSKSPASPAAAAPAVSPGSSETSPKLFRINSAELNKIREDNLAKRKVQTKPCMMPELTEVKESSPTAAAAAAASSSGDKPPCNGTSDHLDPKAPVNKEEVIKREVFPSLSNDVLSKLKLRIKKRSSNAGTTSKTDGLSEQELDEKFASLSLAFKTDKQTLEKRRDLHKRARDVAEQNIDREMNGLKEALKEYFDNVNGRYRGRWFLFFLNGKHYHTDDCLALGSFCTDPQSRDIYTKIQHHIEVLEQSSSRMSSRSEVHGAVQQEMRVSQAVEVMISHVENLKRLYEKEHQELEETKKVLHENNLNEDGQRRSIVAGGNVGAKGGRRRASVAAFPRATLGSISAASGPLFSKDNAVDPKSRFASLFDSATSPSPSHSLRRTSLFAGSHTAAVRRASFAMSPSATMDTLSLSSSPSPLLPLPAASASPSSSPSPLSSPSASILRKRNSNSESVASTTTIREDEESPTPPRPARVGRTRSIVDDDDGTRHKDDDDDEEYTVLPAITESVRKPLKPAKSPAKPKPSVSSSPPPPPPGELQTSQQSMEEVFQKGYEEGLRAQMSEYMDALKQQQLVFQGTLQTLMDATMDDNNNSMLNTPTTSRLKRVIHYLIAFVQEHSKERFGQKMRFLAAGLLFFASILILLFNFLPSARSDPHHNHSICSSSSLFLKLWPFASLSHYGDITY